MTRASDIRKNDVIHVQGVLYVVRQIDVQSPSARGAATLYRIRAAAVQGGQKFENRFKGDEELETAGLNRRSVQFSYLDGDDCVFMDLEDFSQYVLPMAQVQEQMSFINEDTSGLLIMLVDEQPIGLELPAMVELDVVETAPAMKTASASARTKPATLATGLVIQVPEYIESGERVRVNTQERRFASRA